MATGAIMVPQAVAPLKAKLSTGPCTLHDLWVKWQFCFAERKPENDFNSEEQGTIHKKHILVLQGVLGQGGQDGQVRLHGYTA